MRQPLWTARGVLGFMSLLQEQESGIDRAWKECSYVPMKLYFQRVCVCVSKIQRLYVPAHLKTITDGFPMHFIFVLFPHAG